MNISTFCRGVVGFLHPSTLLLLPWQPNLHPSISQNLVISFIVFLLRRLQRNHQLPHHVMYTGLLMPSSQNPALNSCKPFPKHLPYNSALCQRVHCLCTFLQVKHFPLCLFPSSLQMPKRKGADGDTPFADWLLFTGFNVGPLCGAPDLVYQVSIRALESERHGFKSWW